MSDYRRRQQSRPEYDEDRTPVQVPHLDRLGRVEKDVRTMREDLLRLAEADGRILRQLAEAHEDRLRMVAAIARIMSRRRSARGWLQSVSLIVGASVACVGMFLRIPTEALLGVLGVLLAVGVKVSDAAANKAAERGAREGDDQ